MKNGEMMQKTSVKGVKEEMGYVMGRTKKGGTLFYDKVSYFPRQPPTV